MEHRGGRWTIIPNAQARPAVEPGWDRVAFVQGTPLVIVRTPDGRNGYALVDTGAPDSRAIGGYREGTYILPTVDGRTALRIPVTKTIEEWKGLNLDGKHIEMVIGMETLMSRDWRMTFQSGHWIFAPPAP